MSKLQRLYSIDVLRGMALSGMILVNNPGDWGNIYTPFEHAEFVGLTLADLVFPTFMFVMGFCIPLAMRRFDAKLTKDSFMHILKRTLIIFTIGLFLQWMSSGWCAWENLRIPGVLQRLALSYFFGTLIYICCSRIAIITIATLILVIYGFILNFFNGFEWSEMNINARIDLLLLGSNHLYVDNGIRLDPEGILSTLPSIAHVLIGVSLASEYIKILNDEKLTDDHSKFRIIVKTLLMTGFSFITTSILLHLDSQYIIKKIWSPSFVIITTGIAATALGLLTYIIDQRKLSGWWSNIFVIFGRQPLAMYVISWILSELFGQWDVTLNVYRWFCTFFTSCTSSLLYAILFVIINWIIAYLLNKSLKYK